MTARPAAAQSDARLVGVVQLAQNGMADSARAVVSRLLEQTDPADSLYAEMLYTSGIVAATEYDRRIALRRVVVEYSTSGWADDALLLLGQVEYANGNPGSALAQFSRLVTDYPSSQLLATAAFWGARAAADLRNGAAACDLADKGLAAASNDVELSNQLRYQRQRCEALQLAGPGPDTTRAAKPDSTPVTPPPPPPPPPARPPVTKGLFVQTIAAPTQAAADEMLAKVKEAGFDAIVVREGGYFKVRAGPFPTRAAASSALSRIRTRLGGQPFIVNVP
ncbi:MAG: SPOR domain-containing protein [Gemmatimonadales bacterium]